MVCKRNPNLKTHGINNHAQNISSKSFKSWGNKIISSITLKIPGKKLCIKRKVFFFLHKALLCRGVKCANYKRGCKLPLLSELAVVEAPGGRGGPDPGLMGLLTTLLLLVPLLSEEPLGDKIVSPIPSPISRDREERQRQLRIRNKLRTRRNICETILRKPTFRSYIYNFTGMSLSEVIRSHHLELVCLSRA